MSCFFVALDKIFLGSSAFWSEILSIFRMDSMCSMRAG